MNLKNDIKKFVDRFRDHLRSHSWKGFFEPWIRRALSHARATIKKEITWASVITHVRQFVRTRRNDLFIVLGAYGLVFFLASLFYPTNLALHNFNPNPYFFLNLVFSATYGLSTCYGISILFFVFYLISNYLQVDPLSVESYISIEFLKLPISSFVVSWVLAYLRDRKVRSTQLLEQEIKDKLLVIDDLSLANSNLFRQNTDFKSRLVTQFETTAELFKIAKGLNQKDLNVLLKSCIEILQSTLETRRVLVYLRNPEHHFELKWQLLPGSNEIVMPESRTFLSSSNLVDPIVHRSFETRVAQSIGDIDIRSQQLSSSQDQAILCAPLLNNAGEVIALIIVYEMEFLKFTKSNIRYFSLFSEWASLRVQEILRFDFLREGLAIDQSLGIYEPSFLEERLEQEKQRAKSSRRTLVVLNIRFYWDADPLLQKKNAVMTVVSKVIAEKKRPFDILGKTIDPDLWQCIMPSISKANRELFLKSLLEDFHNLGLSESSGFQIELKYSKAYVPSKKLISLVKSNKRDAA